ncbi:hypothetical protein AA59_14855 [Listeria monocytogenes]|nr:hypothetical protein [Listeria monocytogenes]MBM5606663.1 hypothetical protein [Listeria seeligeri]EAC8007148.1 hypothetical protein [Listeria monocytogenes]EAD6723869.1 hypothetical protein [Listeria monocytogenes]MDB57241.1 hypothetical protein [Listeria monocytogenes]
MILVATFVITAIECHHTILCLSVLLYIAKFTLKRCNKVELVEALELLEPAILVLEIILTFI